MSLTGRLGGSCKERREGGTKVELYERVIPDVIRCAESESVEVSSQKRNPDQQQQRFMSQKTRWKSRPGLPRHYIGRHFQRTLTSIPSHPHRSLQIETRNTLHANRSLLECRLDAVIACARFASNRYSNEEDAATVRWTATAENGQAQPLLIALFLCLWLSSSRKRGCVFVG